MEGRESGEIQAAWCFCPGSFVRPLAFRKENMWTLSWKLTSLNPSVPSHQLESSHVSPRVFLPHMKTILLAEAINDRFSTCLLVWNLQWCCLASPGQEWDSGRGQLRGGAELFLGAHCGAHLALSFCADSNEREAKSALWRNSQEIRVGEKPVKMAENKSFTIVSCHASSWEWLLCPFSLGEWGTKQVQGSLNQPYRLEFATSKPVCSLTTPAHLCLDEVTGHLHQNNVDNILWVSTFLGEALNN